MYLMRGPLDTLLPLSRSCSPVLHFTHNTDHIQYFYFSNIWEIRQIQYEIWEIFATYFFHNIFKFIIYVCFFCQKQSNILQSFELDNVVVV